MKTTYSIAAILPRGVDVDSWGWAFRPIRTEQKTLIEDLEDEPYHGPSGGQDGTILFASAIECIDFLVANETWGPWTELDIDQYTDLPAKHGPTVHYVLTIDYEAK